MYAFDLQLNAFVIPLVLPFVPVFLFHSGGEFKNVQIEGKGSEKVHIEGKQSEKVPIEGKESEAVQNETGEHQAV